MDQARKPDVKGRSDEHGPPQQGACQGQVGKAARRWPHRGRADGTGWHSAVTGPRHLPFRGWKPPQRSGLDGVSGRCGGWRSSSRRPC
jgi:hypothetical protein